MSQLFTSGGQIIGASASSSPGEGNGNPPQYPCLENLMDTGAWWAAVHGVAKSQAQLSDFTISWSLLRLMFIESVVLLNHLILGHPLLLLPAIFPSIRVFSNESALHIRWPK